LKYEALYFFQQYYDQQIYFPNFLLALMETSDVMFVPNAQDTPDIKEAEPIIWNYYKMDGAQSKRGCAKNAMCACAPFVILLSPVVVSWSSGSRSKNSKYWIVCTDT
jgi:hypothetical protein